MNLSEMTVNELAGIKYKCSCGKIHSVEIESVDISYKAMDNAVSFIAGKIINNIQIMCDENTYIIAAKDFSQKLTSAGISNNVYIIKGRNGLNVAPNDACIGEIISKLNRGTEFFVAVGSGVINDLTRQISYKMGVEYMVLATAPSMDGYASVTSSLILNNVKESIQGQYPKAIFAPLDILKNAPYNMVTAGFGDVIGKYNAIREWQFGRDYKNEHYCPEIAELIENVVNKCRKTAPELIKRSDEAIINIMEGLILAGMAMGLYQNTRPASGAEHHIVHFWDVDCIQKGREHELHGNSVGIGTLVICRLYDLVQDKLPVEVKRINASDIEEILNQAGCMTTPQEAGIDRALFKASIINGHIMSSKYTILTYLSEEKPYVLEKVAEKLCCEFYQTE